MAALPQDLKFGLRMLLRKPLLTAGNGVLVSGNYFDLLGVKAARGRTFQPEEDQRIRFSSSAISFGKRVSPAIPRSSERQSF